MSSATRRRPLGQRADLSARSTLFEIDGGLERVSRSLVEIRIQRVMADEVVMVSLHRAIPVGRVVVHALLALVFASAGAMTAAATATIVPAIVLGLVALPFLVLAVVLLVSRIDVVTAASPRASVSAEFLLDKRRAARLYASLCSSVRHAQGRLRPPAGEDEAPGSAVP